ncbi:DUF3619 family protein [Thiobacter aerophilum]|uniref:DUF3619 family protein n=1 Tax=Thiobacter aerophilum TaxID=3121275 RepID=A0ABV0EHH1_9BURK
MNETEFARRIREHLNFGACHLDRKVLTRLEAARRQALAGLAVEPAHEHAWQWATAGHGRHGSHPTLRRWLPLAMLLALLAGALYWQQTFHTPDEDVDAALLADDLPLDAYLDHGFQAWLERSSQR